jgi:hypothetical protein
MKFVALALVLFASIIGYQEYRLQELRYELDITMEVLIKAVQHTLSHDGGYNG